MFWDPDALEKFKELQEARYINKCNISCDKIQDLEKKLVEYRQEVQELKQKINSQSDDNQEIKMLKNQIEVLQDTLNKRK